MANEIVLSPREQKLACLAFLVVSSAIGLSLCIGLLFPEDWILQHTKNKSNVAPNKLCKCPSNKYNIKYINCLPSFLIENITMNSARTAKFDDTCRVIENYPYLVSLTIPAYSDSKRDRRYACSGVILSQVWVLIGRECDIKHDEWPEVKLRAGSAYWSKGGSEHFVQLWRYFNNHDPLLIQVSPPFNFRKTINAAIISTSASISWNLAVTVGWSKDINKKHNKFTVDSWTKESCLPEHCKQGELRNDVLCTNNETGRALITEQRFLIGFQTGICNLYQFISVHIFKNVLFGEYKQWLSDLLELSQENNTPTMVDLNYNSEPIKIYESKECVISNRFLMTEDVSTSSSGEIVDDTIVQMFKTEDGDKIINNKQAESIENKTSS